MVVVRSAFYSRRSTILILVLATAAGLWLGRPGPLVAIDQQQSRLDITALAPHGDLTIGQTILAQHNGFSAVEVLASVPSASTGAALTLSLADSSGRTIAATTFANVKHNQPLHLGFNPLGQSQGKTYTLLISAGATNQASVWAYSLGGYQMGALLVGGSPGAGDLQFSTYYTFLWPDMLREALSALARLTVWAIPFGLVLFGPGLLLIEAGLGQGLEGWPGVRWGLALGLSLSVLPLVWLWVTVLGLRLSAVILVTGYGLVGVALLWRWLGRLRGWRSTAAGNARALISRSGPLALLAVILVLGLAVRLLAVRDLAYPSWVDSPHHALIVNLMATTGRVPDGYQPVLPIDNFIYHFGFHALAATLQWLTGLSTPALFLLLGQVLNALVPLGIYTFVTTLTGRPRAGLLAAFFVGLVSLFPAYYVSWGRYTQLAGAVILMPALAAVWALVGNGPNLSIDERGWPPNWYGLLTAALLAAGLALTHYRVLSFFAVAVLVALALGRRHGWKAMLAVALVGGAITLPWLVRLATRALLPALGTPGGLAAESGYNALPTGYFQSDLERGWLVIALIAAAVGMLKKSRPVWFAVAWTVVTFALLNIGPGTWLVNNNSWTIMLFVPGSMVLGWGADTWLRAAQSLSPATRWLRRTAGLTMLAGFAALVAWAGLRGLYAQISVANPATVLALAADAQAIDWIEKNTPTNSVFMINGWEWMPGIWSGSDGGVWLMPLSGRRTTLPPVDYIDAPALKGSVNQFNAQAAGLPEADSTGMLALLRANGITDVFIGAHGGFLKPEMFASNPNYQLLYSNGATWVFALKPLPLHTSSAKLGLSRLKISAPIISTTTDSSAVRASRPISGLSP